MVIVMRSLLLMFPVVEHSIVMSVCLSVCAYLGNFLFNLIPNFLCTLPMTVARSSSGGDAIRYF